MHYFNNRNKRRGNERKIGFQDGGDTTDNEAQFVAKMYGLDAADTKTFDHTPHDIFVQMSELSPEYTFWEERSRWIKYEECKELGNHFCNIWN